MAEVRGQQPHQASPLLTPQQQQQQQSQQQQARSPLYHVVRATTAVTAGGSFLLLSGLLLVATVIGLIVATPILVIFSPVLVPAVITVTLILGGFVTSGGFGITAVTLLKWMYDYVSGKHPAGADQLDQARHKLAGKARDAKEYGEQVVSGRST